MRILKRNLAFMLAMIMALSLTAFAGYEDYSDVNELTYVEAVDVLTELGIVEGSDGALLPTGNLTRAQAAKLIAYTMLGKKAADALQAEVAPFVDVPTYHWAAGYVEYCADQGIIGGMGDGTYAPEANVTGSQYAKMLLCAIGYGEKGEFTGASWDSTVNSMATKLGVFDGNLDVVFADAVTREEAFLYTFNALTKVMEVTYSADADEYYAGTVFNSIKGFDFDETLGAKLYDLSEKNGEDDFGREGHYWYKGAKKITGLYANKADAVYTTTVKSKAIYADLDLDKTTMATVIHNGKEIADFQLKKGLGTNLGVSGKGVLVEAYMDDDMDVTLIVIDTYLAQVDDVTSDMVDFTVFTKGGNVTVANHETTMDLVEDEYVLVTMVNNKIKSIKAVEEVTGEIDAHGANPTYTEMNETKYDHAKNLVVNDVAFDTDMIMMLDEYGYMIGLVKADVAENLAGYVLVTDSEVRAGSLASADKALVEVLHLDGTGYEVLNLDTKRDKNASNQRATFYKNAMGAWVEIKVDADDMIPYGFYGYTMTDDGEIVLKDLSKTNAADVQALAKFGGAIKADGKTQNFTFNGSVMDLVLDNDTVLNMVEVDELEVFEGYKNIKIDETDKDILVVYKGRTVETIYVVDGNMLDNAIIAYYDDEEEGKVIDGEDYILLYIDGTAAYYNVEAIAGTLVEGAYEVEMEDGELTKMTLLAADTAAEVVTVSKAKYFDTNATSWVTYADGVKVVDMTDDGALVADTKVAKDDTVLFINKGDDGANVATYIWILKHNTNASTITPDNVAGDIVATWDGDNQWIRFAGLKNTDTAKLEIKVLQRIDGAYGYVTSLTPVWDATNNWHAADANALTADGNVVFQLFLNGEMVAASQAIITK